MIRHKRSSCLFYYNLRKSCKRLYVTHVLTINKNNDNYIYIPELWNLVVGLQGVLKMREKVVQSGL